MIKEKAMNNVLVLVLVIILLMYTWRNLDARDVYEILQVKPPQLTAALLLEKNPIVVESNDAKAIVQGLGYTNINQQVVEGGEVVVKVKSRFAVIFHRRENEKVQVQIWTPKHWGMAKDDPEYKSMTIVLNDKHMLILPMLWRYQVLDQNVKTMRVVNVNDLFSSMYSMVAFW